MNPKARHALVYGYLRQNTPRIDTKLPSELYMLCLRFFSESMQWTLEHKSLSDFFEDARERLILGPQFQIENVCFQLLILLKQFKQRFHVIFGFMAEPQSFSTFNIKAVTIHFTLSLHEMGYAYKDTKRLVASDYRAVWYWPQIQFSALKMARLSALHFECFARILSIEHQHGHRAHFGSAPTMNVRHEYEWRLSDEEQRRFYACHFDESVYSPNFNDECFCVVVSPNGISTSSTESEGRLAAKLKLLRLPVGVGALLVKFQLQIKARGMESPCVYRATERFEYRGMADFCMGALADGDAKDLTLEVRTEIQKVFDEHNAEIPKDEWTQCFVIN